MKIIFLDTETTGNDVVKDRLCQICYRLDGGPTVTAYFKPPLPMSVKAMSITHITNKMLEDKPAFAESQVKRDLGALLAEGVMVAHNAPFDKAILEAEGLTVPRFICTMRLALYFDTKGIIEEFNLQYLRYLLDLEVEGNPHDAEGDVNAAEALFRRLFAKMRQECGSDDEAIERMIDISSKPCLYKKFTFGKHKGELIEDVAKSDRDYLVWLLRQKQATPEMEVDWIYTLSQYVS